MNEQQRMEAAVAATREDGFDYVAETELTASNVFAPENVGVQELLFLLEDFVDITKGMDQFKKALFRKRSRTESGLPADITGDGDSLLTLPQFSVGVEAFQHTDLFHGVIGNITEVGEQAEILIAFLKGERVDLVNVREEIGDNLWYLARLVKYCDSTFLAEMQRNIAKLRQRHGTAGFNKERDITRDLHEERDVLEGPNGKSL